MASIAATMSSHAVVRATVENDLEELHAAVTRLIETVGDHPAE